MEEKDTTWNAKGFSTVHILSSFDRMLFRTSWAYWTFTGFFGETSQLIVSSAVLNKGHTVSKFSIEEKN